MDGPLQSLEGDLGGVRSAWIGALPAFGLPCTDPHAQVTSMSDAGLLRTTDAVAQLVRTGQALLSQLAGEVARRSPREAGSAGLAKKQGYQNPVQLVADSTGGGYAGAAKLVAVGRATATRQSITGEPLPPTHPHVAAALRGGTISIEAANAITRMLDHIAPRTNPTDADRFERLLAQRAGDLPLDLLMRAVRDVEARLDPDGVEPREEELRAARSLTMRQDSHSMLRLTAVLDPETAAPIQAAIEAIVTHGIRTQDARAQGEGGAGGGKAGDAVASREAATGSSTERGTAAPVVDDTRSIPQRQADALAMIARHALGCNRLPDAPAMAVVVRTDLETLVDGLGHGTVDGLDQPLSAGTVRRLAASAGIIPAVLGTASIPLDLGRTNRLFSTAQKIALAERDGGCACCGIDISYAEAHHIAWWVRDHGRTDLDNGVMLCPPCHTRVHNDGWVIAVKDAEVWFTPPPHVDPAQKPRLGGRARFRVDRRQAPASGPPRRPAQHQPATAKPGAAPGSTAPPGGPPESHERHQQRARRVYFQETQP